MGKKNTYIPSQTENKKNKEQGLVRFLHDKSEKIKKEKEEKELERKRKEIEAEILTQSEKIEKKAEKLRERQELERKRLYKQKQKELEKTEILDLTDIEATSVIPTKK